MARGDEGKVKLCDGRTRRTERRAAAAVPTATSFILQQIFLRRRRRENCVLFPIFSGWVGCWLLPVAWSFTPCRGLLDPKSKLVRAQSKSKKKADSNHQNQKSRRQAAGKCQQSEPKKSRARATYFIYILSGLRRSEG